MHTPSSFSISARSFDIYSMLGVQVLPLPKNKQFNWVKDSAKT